MRVRPPPPAQVFKNTKLPMKYHPTVSTIVKLLKNNNCWFETFEHEPVKTSLEASKVRPDYSISQGAKAMIVRIKFSPLNQKFAMFVLPGDTRFDNRRVKCLLGAKDIRLATPEEVINLTHGIELGGVPPFGNLFGLEIIADQTLFEHKTIIFNAGDKRYSIAMKSVDYLRVALPKVSSIIAD